MNNYRYISNHSLKEKPNENHPHHCTCIFPRREDVKTNKTRQMCCWKVPGFYGNESPGACSAEAKYFMMSFSWHTVLKYFKVMWHGNYLG